MKRSEINSIMLSSNAFIRDQGFYLPPFAYWNIQDWQSKCGEGSEIVENHLGWDITDFGLSNFQKIGLFLFTLRNGNPNLKAHPFRKTYAEKIMVVEDGQLTPLHFHRSKMEDIINRGGGQLKLRLYPASQEEGLVTKGEVIVKVDGCARRITAGEVTTLSPGESITIETYCYHEFWGEGRVLVGEVSMVNDDLQDNRFLQTVGRFPSIEEDVEPLYLLVNDYEKYFYSARE